jgi:hypothetical protein
MWMDSPLDVDGQLADCSRMYQYISVVLLSRDSKLSLLSSTYTANLSCSPTSQSAGDRYESLVPFDTSSVHSCASSGDMCRLRQQDLEQSNCSAV